MSEILKYICYDVIGFRRPICRRLVSLEHAAARQSLLAGFTQKCNNCFRFLFFSSFWRLAYMLGCVAPSRDHLCFQELTWDEATLLHTICSALLYTSLLLFRNCTWTGRVGLTFPTTIQTSLRCIDTSQVVSWCCECLAKRCRRLE